ncbi:MAG: 50S ribosomal protein L13 [Patescibacteria group bacterium]
MKAQKNQNQDRRWHLLDADGAVLGRLSTQVAGALRGKIYPGFRPNLDQGDFVVVINCGKVRLTGNKEEQKRYYHHTGYLGNLKETSLAELRAKKPEEIIRRAVWGMLPKNKLRDIFMKRLKVYAGATHPHTNAKFKN